MSVLHDSVGAGGRNRHFDVRMIQSLLTAAGWHPGVVDGVCGRRTLSAIVAFQRHFMHHPDGLVEPRRQTWRMLTHPHHQQTSYRSLNHASARTSSSAPTEAAPSATTSPAAQAPIVHRAVPQARAIQLTAKDILDSEKTLQTGWVPRAGPDQAYGIIDTILNRLASGHWGNTIADVVNARKQFSDINGPPAWNGKDALGIGPHSQVEQIPSNYITARTDKLVKAYLIERAQGRASIVGTNLDYANPDPRYSSPNNLGWINKLGGPSFGKGSAVHRHGTTADKEKFRPRPYYILLPAKIG